MIAHDTGTPLDLVKKALCVLIQHSLALFRVSRRGQVEYEADCTRVLRLQRYPRYIYTAKTLYGDTGELAVEELLQHGKMSMSAVVRRVADRLTDSMEGEERGRGRVCVCVCVCGEEGGRPAH
ncbi:DNA-directed RNA polymerase III subunit RPC3 isoform X1 [Acipenser oxyrinchus oxyrinchus]|uniref:DNA-directed RNA polymerase III subunit RPC3 n=1 Tax=Acipenser oxyrinchus oxyrinchus TaxID=40147 RepID=A0AAD8CK95_ACIOX|nr:DNA-directed RNA polymerase III subunit RPC3 isoform X1 [Acipenser oxyrinchus oxyrinchus]